MTQQIHSAPLPTHKPTPPEPTKNATEQKVEQAAALILQHEESVLILQRGPTAPWYPNAWNLPGGGVDEGETHEEAALRECREETGIELSSACYICKNEHPDYHVLFFEALCDKRPEVHLNFENTNYTWITKSQLGAYNFVPDVKEAIEGLFPI